MCLSDPVGSSCLSLRLHHRVLRQETKSDPGEDFDSFSFLSHLQSPGCWRNSGGLAIILFNDFKKPYQVWVGPIRTPSLALNPSIAKSANEHQEINNREDLMGMIERAYLECRWFLEELLPPVKQNRPAKARAVKILSILLSTLRLLPSLSPPTQVCP